MEIWKDIEGYNGKYQISNNGNVRSFSKWKNGDFLRFGMTTTGYYYVNLVVDGRRKIKQERVHRLVAKAFLDNPNNLPEVNHIDGNKLNNNVNNLEWVSRNQNIQHAYDTKLIPKFYGKRHPLSKQIVQKRKDGSVVKVWGSLADINRQTGYAMNGIICCCKKKPRYHTAYGFIWEYKE